MSDDADPAEPSADSAEGPPPRPGLGPSTRVAAFLAAWAGLAALPTLGASAWPVVRGLWASSLPPDQKLAPDATTLFSLATPVVTVAQALATILVGGWFAQARVDVAWRRTFLAALVLGELVLVPVGVGATALSWSVDDDPVQRSVDRDTRRRAFLYAVDCGWEVYVAGPMDPTATRGLTRDCDCGAVPPATLAWTAAGPELRGADGAAYTCPPPRRSGAGCDGGGCNGGCRGSGCQCRPGDVLDPPAPGVAGCRCGVGADPAAAPLLFAGLAAVARRSSSSRLRRAR